MERTIDMNMAAATLGVSYRTLQRYCRKGLPYTKKGRNYFFSQDELLSFHDKSANSRLSEKFNSPCHPSARSQETLIARLQDEIEFLRGQIQIKDRQIGEQMETIRNLARRDGPLPLQASPNDSSLFATKSKPDNMTRDIGSESDVPRHPLPTVAEAIQQCRAQGMKGPEIKQYLLENGFDLHKYA